MFYAIRPCARTRVPSPRQLPTDHDCAVPTRGYQSDQPSHLLLPATRAASPLYAPGSALTSACGSHLLWFFVTLDKVAPYQNISFSASCRIRGLPADVIWPVDVEPR